MNFRMNLLTGKLSYTMITVAIIAFAVSCKKSTDDTPSPSTSTPAVVGTYYGNLQINSYNEPDTVVIKPGSGSAVVMTSKTGTGSTYSINGTANGNKIDIASQSVYVSSLNATYTVTGSGTLTNSTLVINYTFVSSANVTTNSTFTGTKQ